MRSILAILFLIRFESLHREFVLGSYQELKKANPNFPILVREASGTQARLVARYGKAVQSEKMVRATAKNRKHMVLTHARCSMLAGSESTLLIADFGVEKLVVVDGLDKAAISKKLEELVADGDKMPR